MWKVTLIVAALAAVSPPVFLGIPPTSDLAPISAVRGEIDAKNDVSHGIYNQLGYGLPAPWIADYTSLLRQRYGVVYSPVAGCVVREPLRAYVAAYNGVSMEAARKKFGHDIFREVSDEAKAAWKRARSK